jgi:hypothetical protein
MLTATERVMIEPTSDPSRDDSVSTAMRRWGVPECLHVPVAVDEAAITDHIGDIVKVLSPGKALLVAIEPPRP